MEPLHLINYGLDAPVRDVRVKLDLAGLVPYGSELEVKAWTPDGGVVKLVSSKKGDKEIEFSLSAIEHYTVINISSNP